MSFLSLGELAFVPHSGRPGMSTRSLDLSKDEWDRTILSRNMNDGTLSDEEKDAYAESLGETSSKSGEAKIERLEIPCDVASRFFEAGRTSQAEWGMSDRYSWGSVGRSLDAQERLGSTEGLDGVFGSLKGIAGDDMAKVIQEEKEARGRAEAKVVAKELAVPAYIQQTFNWTEHLRARQAKS